MLFHFWYHTQAKRGFFNKWENRGFFHWFRPRKNLFCNGIILLIFQSVKYISHFLLFLLVAVTIILEPHRDLKFLYVLLILSVFFRYIAASISCIYYFLFSSSPGNPLYWSRAFFETFNIFIVFSAIFYALSPGFFFIIFLLLCHSL